MQLGLINTLLSPQLTQNVSDLRARIAVTSTEAVTGRYVDLTEHLNGRIGDAMLTQKALDDIERENSKLDLLMSRLELTQQSLETIQLSGEGIGTRVLGSIAVNNVEQIEVGGQDAKVALDRIFSALSTRFGQRHLFSGDATASGAVDLTDDMLTDVRDILLNATDAADFEANIDTYFNDPAGGWQTDIYNGTPTTSDPNGVLAIDPAITEMVKGLAVLALADDHANHSILSADTTDVLKTASQTVTTATELVIDLRVRVGRSEEQILARQDTLVAETTILSETFNDMTGRDQFEAATELQQLESSLQASYLLTARLSNLTLLNFIR